MVAVGGQIVHDGALPIYKGKALPFNFNAEAIVKVIKSHMNSRSTLAVVPINIGYPKLEVNG